VATWQQIEAEAPELVARARRLFDANKHKTLATLRRNGSPRISGSEIIFADGQLWFGSMWQAVKALDLQRDPRFALHSGSDEPDGWNGDAKLAGVAEEVVDEARVKELNGEAGAHGPSHLFRLDLHEVSTVGLDEAKTHLIIDVWTPEHGLRTITRK